MFTETVESQDVPSAAVENESPSESPVIEAAAVENESPSESPVTENQQSSESASAE